MAFLNIVSVPKHIDELRILLSDNPFDVVALNETRLDPSISDNEMKIQNYDLIRKDRCRYGGGVGFYLKTNSIKYKYTKRPELVPEGLEAICVQIEFKATKPFIIATLYRPDSPVEYFLKLKQFIGHLDSEDKEFYLLGDLNCDWLKQFEYDTRRLVSICDIYQLSQLVNQPTRITSTSSTLLDVLITNEPDNINDIGIFHTGLSDHSLIFGTRKMNQGNHMTCVNRTKVIPTRSFRKFSLQNFLNDLREQKWSTIQFLSSADEMWLSWKTIFMTIVEKHAPLKKMRVKESSLPWVTSEIKEIMRKRDSMKKAFVDTKDFSFWAQYTKLRNKTNILIRRNKREYYYNKLEEAKNDPKRTWKTINSVMNRHTKPLDINEIKCDDQVLTDVDSICECFNDYFVNIGPKLASEMNNNNTQNVLDYIQPVSSTFDFSPTNKTTVESLIHKLSSSKATGLDGISAKLLKCAAPIISESITHIFNAALQSGSFPDDWKIARVSPVYKDGPRNILGNYRPISILPVLSKVFERILYNQLYQYLLDNKILSDNQFGFRKDHSTMYALLHSTNSWFMNTDKGLFNIVVFLDLKKAFDTVNHQILLAKLKLYGINQLSLDLMHSYLSNRKQICSMSGARSSKKTVLCGVPQGSILGPLLFLLFINDLPNCLDTSIIPCLFADDTNITVSDSDIHRLEFVANNELRKVSTWLSANKLHLNVAKTEFMVIGSPGRLNSIEHKPVLKIGDEVIKQVSQSKSVGVIIDEHLNWSQHISHLIRKVVSGLGALKRVRPFVPQHTLIAIYNALIQSHFDYCCVVWGNMNKTLADKLQILQNRAAKIILHADYRSSSSWALQQLNWEKLDEKREKQILMAIYKIKHNKAPVCFSQMFTNRNETLNYNLRNSSMNICIRRPNTEYLKRSFCYKGAKSWNSAPFELRNAKSVSQLKNNLKTTTLLKDK